MDNVGVNATTNDLLKSFETWFGNWISPPDKSIEKYYKLRCHESTYVYFKRVSSSVDYMPTSAIVFLRATDRIIKIYDLNYSYKTENVWVVEILNDLVKLSDISTIMFLDKHQRYVSSIEMAADIITGGRQSILYTPLLVSAETRRSALSLTRRQMLGHMMYSIKTNTLLLDLNKRLQFNPDYPEENPQISYHEFKAGDRDVGVTKERLYLSTIRPLITTFAFVRDDKDDIGLVGSFGKLDYYRNSMTASNTPSICALDTVLTTVRELILRASKRFPGSFSDSENQILGGGTDLPSKCKLFLEIERSIRILKLTNGTGKFVINDRIHYYVNNWALVEDLSSTGRRRPGIFIEPPVDIDNKETAKLLGLIANIEVI